VVRIPAGLDDIDPLRRDPSCLAYDPKGVTVNELSDTKTEESHEDVLVYAWRVEQLARLGLSTIIASAVASLVDWHEVARLVQHGCSPELALEIVR
jgi:hypothetical protein